MIQAIRNAPATKLVTLLLPGQMLIQILPGSTLSKVARVFQNAILFGSGVHCGSDFFKSVPLAITLVSIEPVVWTAIQNPELLMGQLLQSVHLVGYVGSLFAGIYMHDLIQNLQS